MVDYQGIIANLDNDKIFRLLEKLGGEPIDKVDAIISKTICHNPNDEASHKLYYYKNTHAFVCYTECGSLSIFKFLKAYYECHNIEYEWHDDILNVALKCANMFSDEPGFKAPKKYSPIREKYEQRKVRKELVVYPDGVLGAFIKDYPPEWLNDGIDREAMDKYNIRFSISQNKIIIPHYNAQGELIGIRGRALNEWEIENLGKYMPVQLENKWYAHPLGLNLYGLNFAKENIRRYGICYVFEAEKSALSIFLLISRVTSCG